MNRSLNQKFIISSVVVVILTGLVATWIGIHLFEVSTLREVRSRVETDLNVAAGVFRDLIDDLATAVRLAADNTLLVDALQTGEHQAVREKLRAVRTREGLDFLTLLDANGKVLLRTTNSPTLGDDQSQDEIISAVITGYRQVVAPQILAEPELLKESDSLLAKATLTVINTGSPTESPTTLKSGLVIKSAAPVFAADETLIGVLYGGILLNRNYTLVDEIASILFGGELYKGKKLGQVAVFQDDLRIATDLLNPDGSRAVGTKVYEDVSARVIDQGKPYIARAVIRDEWYLSAYQPILSLSRKPIGILGLGIREQKYRDLKNNTLLLYLVVTTAGVVCALFLAFLLARSITKPIRKLVATSKQLAAGDLDVHVGFASTDEIGDLGTAFNLMTHAIKERDDRLRRQAQEEVQQAERMAMIGRLAAGIAHEINNPLGSILLFSRLLMQKAPAEGIIRENLERIERETKRCQTIVQGLLDFARKREPKIEPLNIEDLLDKTLRLFESHPSFHNIELVKDYQAAMPVVLADSSQMMQVFVNMIMNAIDAMEGNGILTISLRTYESENLLKISIGDTGCGIPEEHVAKLFEPFFTTKAVGQGTGLGLSISYGIIQTHGGTIKVFSKVGEGTTFVISLPIARPIL